MIAAAAATTIIGAVIAWQLTSAPRADKAGSGDSAAGNLPVDSLAAITPPHPPAATDVPAAAIAAPPPSPVPPASDGDAPPAMVGEHVPDPDRVAEIMAVASEPGDFDAKAEPPIAKKTPVRPKPVTRRELPRPVKQVDQNLAAGKAPPTKTDTPASPAAPSAGSQAASSQAVAANAGSGASPMDGGRTPPEVSQDRGATTGSPPPAAVPVKPAAPANPGTLDATLEVAGLDVKGSLAPSIVRRSVERALPSLRTCYRTAARASASTPAVELRLTFEIDENRLATQVATSGANFGSLAGCAASVASQIRTQEAPDVGTAQVAVVIRFRPS